MSDVSEKLAKNQLEKGLHLNEKVKHFTTQTIRFVSVDVLKEDPVLKTLFSRQETDIAKLIASMEKNGFMAQFPIILAHGNIPVDGYTRIKAARRLGIKHIPTVDINIPSTDIEELKRIARLAQECRRNISDAAILGAVEDIAPELTVGGDHGNQHTSGKVQMNSASSIANNIGTSETKVKKAIVIRKNASPEIKQAVKEGKISLNKGYHKTKTEKKTETPDPNPKTEIEDCGVLKPSQNTENKLDAPARAYPDDELPRPTPEDEAKFLKYLSDIATNIETLINKLNELGICSSDAMEHEYGRIERRLHVLQWGGDLAKVDDPIIRRNKKNGGAA